MAVTSVPDVDEQYIHIREHKSEAEADQFAEMDPFAKSWEDLKSFKGLNDSGAKRSITRKANNGGIFSLNPTPKYEEQALMQPTGVGASSKQLNPGKDYVNGYGAFDVITPPYSLYQLASFYDASYANHGAIEAKVANSVANGYYFDMTYMSTKRIAEATDEKRSTKISRAVDTAKLEVAAWIESLNDEDSFTTTMIKVVTDLETTGNAYIEVSRTTNGQIGYLGHIPATTMRVRRLRDGFIQIISNKIVYFRNFGATNPDPIGGDPYPNEIIHIKKYSPLNTYYGVPDIASALPSLIGDQQAEQYNIDYFHNKAVPRYIIVTKGVTLSADAEDRLFRFFQTNLKGQNHRTIYVPLPPDTNERKVEFRLEPVENKVQEASFAKYREDNRNNILIAHRVPLSKLGGASSSGAIAAALSSDRTFRDQVSRPLQGYLEKAVSRVVKEMTDMIELKFNEMNIVDEIQQATIHKTYADTGAITPNEIRADLGKPTIKGLDEKVDAQKNPPPSVGARANERVQQSSDGPNAVQGRNPKGSGSKERNGIAG